MKNRLLLNSIGILLLFVAINIHAQSTGYIVRPATGSGAAVLDAGAPAGYTSKTTSGFLGNDVLNSKLPYKTIPSFAVEPFGDLRRGPSHLYSDFVPDATNSGYYAYFDGTNLLFRMRMGSVMPGAKGYSVLLDVDGKFGATGTNADPNYQSATTGTNGNPGFEIEIVLETNSRLAIYNVDGTSSPTLKKAYTAWKDYSQISIAGTFDNGDPDFFLDFYIPFSDLQGGTFPFNLLATTPLRMSATTVMSPQAAIGGPKSDIYGLNDVGYKSTNDEYEKYINAQPSFTTGTLSSTATSIGSICTAPPTLNSLIATGAVTVSGTWTKSDLAGAASAATIYIYINGATAPAAQTATTITSGNAWSVAVTVANGQTITAKAQAAGESQCLASNAVVASSCNPANRPATPVLDCITTTKGISGTNLSTGWTVYVDNITTNTTYNNVTNTTAATFGTTTTGTSPNIAWTFSNGCSGGSPIANGSYKVYYINNATGCESESVYVCSAGNGNGSLAGSLTAPSITSPVNGAYTTATTFITGTTDPAATVFLFVDGVKKQTVTAAATGAFTFSNLSFSVGQQVYLAAELNTGTVTTSKCAAQTTKATVTCFTSTPIINADNASQVAAGASISGIVSEPVGTSIKVYTTANVLVATTTVQSGGVWSTGNASTTPATYVAVAGTAYYATAQNGGCGLSVASGTVTAQTPTPETRCGSITGSITSGTTAISGIVSGTFSTTTVNLYLDGVLIGSSNTTTTAWGPIDVTNKLYSNGVLTIGVQESGKQEVLCSSSAKTVGCSANPSTPIVTPDNATILQNQTQTYTITNPSSGVFYGIADGATGISLATGVWATSNSQFNITTNPITSPGSVSVLIKATSLINLEVCSANSTAKVLQVNPVVMPVVLIHFKGTLVNNQALLHWETATEFNTKSFEIQKSRDGKNFGKVGEVNAKNSTQGATYNYTDAAINEDAYYRLKVLDTDGRYTYSKIIFLSNKSFGVSVATHPNPFVDALSVRVTLAKNGKINLVLFDANGKQVSAKATYGSQGINIIYLGSLKNLSGSVYLLKIITEEGVMQQKLIKENQ